MPSPPSASSPSSSPSRLPKPPCNCKSIGSPASHRCNPHVRNVPPPWWGGPPGPRGTPPSRCRHRPTRHPPSPKATRCPRMIGYPAGSEQVHAAQSSLRLLGVQPRRCDFFAREQTAALRLAFFGDFDAHAPPRTRRASHSLPPSPGLHPSPKRGIKTITGARARPGISARQGTRLRGSAFAPKYQNPR